MPQVQQQDAAKEGQVHKGGGEFRYRRRDRDDGLGRRRRRSEKYSDESEEDEEYDDYYDDDDDYYDDEEDRDVRVLPHSSGYRSLHACNCGRSRKIR